MPSSHTVTPPTGFRGVIAGMGVDLVEIDRFRRMSDLPAFLRQILTEREISDREGIHTDPALCAVLFAIKEAVLKALPGGLERGPAWHDVEITPDFRVVLSGSVKRLADERSVKNILIAPARTGNVAMAVAIAET